jgi:hypothetical protein
MDHQFKTAPTISVVAQPLTPRISRIWLDILDGQVLIGEAVGCTKIAKNL